MHFFTYKIDNIRNTITNVDPTASSNSASFIASKDTLKCFTTIGQEELNKRISASKPTMCLLDPGTNLTTERVDTCSRRTASHYY